ncbi:hypothetical protein BJ508DRAFT_330426 [Ascobolus immersus RN42]|uniref:Altered inheritance of mitochondria protein 19 n=1 Tax=Ascobolus immersus RN42 TaxID=1160509 RepID=A0A3N4HU70_ASCIM|nr:hypothetical protein BJ508DRAFT_330426 [Ascobolus immersus RN42]
MSGITTTNKKAGFGELAKKYTSTPLPGGITAGALLAHLPRSLSAPSLRPGTLPIFVIAPGLAFSGYMSYRGAPREAAGTLAAWSTIYMIAERKSVLKFRGGVRERALFALMGLNAVMGVGGWLNGEKEGGGGGGAGDI